jgi:hypothetical protein
MRERAERTVSGLRAHFLPRDPFERRPDDRRLGDAPTGRRACPTLGRDGEAVARGGGHHDGRVGRQA